MRTFISEMDIAYSVYNTLTNSEYYNNIQGVLETSNNSFLQNFVFKQIELWKNFVQRYIEFLKIPSIINHAQFRYIILFFKTKLLKNYSFPLYILLFFLFILPDFGETRININPPCQYRLI